MTIKKIVYINKKGIVIIPFILNDSDPVSEALLAGIDSGGKWFEVDHIAPAGIGWRYENNILIDPQGNVWSN